MGFFDGLKVLFGSGEKKQTQAQTEAQAQEASVKVLIVEDEDMLATALEMKLKHDGFTVMRAANGQIGFEAAQTFLPDVILADIMMPVMDGKAMIKKLRTIPQFQKTPVIILTNAGTIENMEEAKMGLGISDFLIKSNVNLDEVAAKIRMLVPKPTPVQANQQPT
jgi:DNA-binding response OmpR family regulator